MEQIQLEWKQFSLDLNSVETWMKSNVGEGYRGNSADYCLHLWFEEEPSQEVKDAVASYWEGLTSESNEAAVYKSQEERSIENLAKKVSGKAKLSALGLSDDEIAALVG